MFGTVPAAPHIRLPMPSTFTDPCTARKSRARPRRHDTRWTATELLMVRMVLIAATSRNAGTSAQNAGPKSRSSPGQSAPGRPIQGAAATRSKS